MAGLIWLWQSAGAVVRKAQIGAPGVLYRLLLLRRKRKADAEAMRMVTLAYGSGLMR